MMINRSLPVAILPLVLILTTHVSPSTTLPARRRAPGFVDHFVRPSPMRALANYMGRKLTMNVYYPQKPPQFQLQQHSQSQYKPPQFQLQQYSQHKPPQFQLQHSQRKPRVHFPRTLQKTHYVKLPVYSSKNMVMIPPATPQRDPRLHYQVQMQPQQQLLLHGVSYPVSTSPHTHHYNLQQQLKQSSVYPAVSSYRPAVTTNFQPLQHQLPFSVVPQTSILFNEQAHNSLSSSLIDESVPAAHAATNSFRTSQVPVNSVDEVNEVSSEFLSQQVSPVSQMQPFQAEHGHEDSSSSDDMLRIFVIRPKDMEKFKSSSESERDEMVKKYSMKYIDLEQGAKQLFMNSPGSRGHAQATENDVDSYKQEQETCIEPLCDLFLRKLIPELLASSKMGKDDEDPIVIVKNNTDTTTVNEDSFVQNHKLVDLDLPQEYDDHEGPQFTIVKAVEGIEGLETSEMLQDEHSTEKPPRVDVHFPRKKLFSAKINSTSLRKYESTKPGRMSETLYQKLHGSSPHRQPTSTFLDDHVYSTSTESASSTSEKSTSTEATTLPLMSKPKYLEVGRYQRNRTGSNKNMQRMVRGRNYNENDDSNDHVGRNVKIIHNSAGVVFNNNLKVSK